QIIAHHLKLILAPITLSIDQSAHVKISNDLFGTYPIICSVSLLLILFVPLIIYLTTRKLFPLTLCSLLIFISLIPFSQILSPTYALSAERYLYTPLFFVTTTLGFLLLKLEDTRVSNKIFLTLLSFLLVILTTRTIVRINDWKNNEKLLTSTIQSSPNKLYKGLRTQTLAKVYKAKGQSTKSKLLFDKADDYIDQSIISYQKSRVKEPLILKAYGLDTHSLLLKAGYQKCIDKFVKDKSNTKACLAFFNENIQDISEIDPATLELYANLILENGDKAKAKDLFLYAYNKYPKVPFLLVSLIRFERDIENNLEATKNYVEKARKLFPYSKDILFEALRYYQNAGNFEEYVHHAYLYGLRAHSKFTYLEALTGYLKLNMREKAKLTIDKLLRLDPTDPKIFYMASNFYIKEQDYERAVALLQEGKMNLKEEEDNDLAFKINSTLAELHHA
ncbi:MAG: hypothetical protein HYZ79_03050, partial [Candidatus Melainabacteria bacterium]|nr:hypothetical protein [Candidatus Melainabacteria bacterium]